MSLSVCVERKAKERAAAEIEVYACLLLKDRRQPTVCFSAGLDGFKLGRIGEDLLGSRYPGTVTMWFPGSRLVAEVKAPPPDSLRSLLSRCIETRLTGYLEVCFPEIEVIVLFQNGDTVQVVSKSEDGFHVGRDAVIGLARQWRTQVGAVRVHEMPEEVGRMLRGLHNRVEVARVFSSEQAKQVLERVKAEVDTGAVELHLKIGNAIVLLTGGECVNCYLRTESGSTFENGEALKGVLGSLDLLDGEGRVFVSTYSPEMARTRVCRDLLMKLETLT